MSHIVKDSHSQYLSLVTGQHEDQIVQQAIALLERRLFNPGLTITSPDTLRDYLHLQLVAEPSEIFAVVFLDSRHRVLAYEPLFRGTINATMVYPRVIVQRALALNAAACVLAHQHPSGSTIPSRDDEMLTQRLIQALALVDVRVLDHFIVGDGVPYSFAEHGLL